ncbi:hypothetical protein GTP56_05855 [Duganella sp. FT134W]|uniref:Histidine kinase domain-containing protein n=1 Tax=Duganella margarita TaxID=2692170 RepID=A0A7X4KEU5_9BURK|nr:sensor histidine kinase [Duganella margarita]MYM71721.1 hypothetical protein [Duganella margarita]
MFFRSALFGFLVFLFSTVAAAPLRPYWHTSMVHAAWTKRDGAPAAVFDMAQDQRGMLWFTATDGIYRFDGVRFERTTAIDGNPLRSSNTNGMLAVGTALWIGYNFGGVSVFDQGKVRHYGTAEGLPERSVYRIERNGNGVMWIASSAGLYWLDGARWRHVEPEDGLPSGDFHYFTALPDGSILAYHPQGLYRSSANGHQFHLVSKDKQIEIGHLLPDGDVLAVSVDHRLYRYTPRDDKFQAVNLPGGEQPFGVFVDHRGGIWINTDDGVKLLGRDLRVQRTFLAPQNLSGKLIYSMLEDREGNVWLTTENGVDRIRESRLTAISLPPRMFSGLSVRADRNGTVWIGNYQTTGNYELRSFGLHADGSREATPLTNITATARAPDGSVWFGNAEQIWHREDGRWRSWPLPSGLRGHEVQALAMDRAGRLWVSVLRKGVHVLHEGQWQAGGGHAELAPRTAVSLYADPQGAVWIGYPGNHLALVQGDAVRQFGPEDGLAVGNVTVMDSGAGHLWVGGDQGVAVLAGGRFTALSDAAGARMSGVSGLVASSDGGLWLHGADGLIRITAPALKAALAGGGQRLRAEHFDYLDGHEGKPAQLRPLSALTEAPDGRLWYATTGSVGWIDPARIDSNPLPPAPQITALRTDLQGYFPQSGLVLPQRTTNLELDFTAAALSIPERVRFRYRLVGLESGWRDAGARRTAFYTNLSPGQYRFEVSAMNEDGVWSTTPGVLAFSITPAFTQTLWFKAMCGLVVLGALYLLYCWRLALATRRMAERMGERRRERERIARTLHDNFLQSVQTLMIFFSQVKKGLSPTDPAQKRIDAALDAADLVLNEGRSQVHELRSNTLQEELDSALAGVGQALAEQHGVRFALEVTGAPAPLREEIAAEAYAIAREAMLNAFRHANSDDVRVTLAYTRKHLVLTVADRGQGLSAEVLAAGERPGHWGLPGMRERAESVGGTLAVHSAAGAGTRIILRLPGRRAYRRGPASAILPR